jgi:small conductance mechanosensitive channel
VEAAHCDRATGMMALFNTLPADALTWATNLGAGILILLAFWAASYVAAMLLERFAARAGTGREDVLRLIAQVAKTALLVLGMVTALGTLGVNVSALVTGLGLTGFALGFAFRDALSNVLAGAMILFYRPFRRGDHIMAGSEGTVQEINLRYTIVENATAKVLIPNANLLTNAITVRSTPPGGLRTPSSAAANAAHASLPATSGNSPACEETSDATPPPE